MLLALLVLALLVLVYRRVASGYPPAPPGLAVLFRGEVAFVEATAQVLFPSGSALPVAGRDAHLPHYVDRHLSALPRAKRWQIRGLFLLIENMTLVMPGDEPGGRSRFSSLSAASRVSLLERLADHPNLQVRLLFIALRGVLVLGYLGHPANLRELGVAPFDIDRAVSDAELLFPRVGGLVSSIAFTQADRSMIAVDEEEPGAALQPLDPNGPRHRAYARSSRDSR